MKNNSRRSACTIKWDAFPTDVTCPRCEAEVEIWSDEDETACRLCGYVLFHHEKTIN